MIYLQVEFSYNVCILTKLGLFKLINVVYTYMAWCDLINLCIDTQRVHDIFASYYRWNLVLHMYVCILTKIFYVCTYIFSVLNQNSVIQIISGHVHI